MVLLLPSDDSVGTLAPLPRGIREPARVPGGVPGEPLPLCNALSTAEGRRWHSWRPPRCLQSRWLPTWPRVHLKAWLSGIPSTHVHSLQR